MKIPRRKALWWMFQSAVSALAIGSLAAGCGGSGGSGGGGAPVTSTTTPVATTTVLASLEKHIGGPQNIGYEPNTKAGGSTDRINTINSAQGVLTGTGIIFTVNGDPVGNSQSPPDATNSQFRPENYVVRAGDSIEWFDVTGGSSIRVKYPVVI